MNLTVSLKLKRIRLLGCLLIATLFFSFSAFAQSTITGKVTDNNGNPLFGASVVIKGDAKKGTTTNENGFFSITASKGEIVEVSMIGYETTSITVGDQTSLNEIKLKSEPGMLKEVIMIAYGSVQRKDAVGAINTISGKDFDNRSAILPAELIQGKAAGVQVVRRSGDPAAPLEVIIRGSGSFTNVGPLYIVDGIRSEGLTFNSLHPQDIESITILKDASSTAIYGANGANGVVIITTKKGKAGPPVISFSTQWGFAKTPKKHKLLNAAQYRTFAQQYALAQNPPFNLPSDFSTSDGADWQDEIFKTAVVSSNHIGVSGGSEKILYNISAGYSDHQSIIRNYQAKVANLHFSLQEKFGIFEFGQQINLQYRQFKGTNASMLDALAMPPYMKVHDPGSPSGFSTTGSADYIYDTDPIVNPIATISNINIQDRLLVLNPQFFGEVNITKSLKLRSQVSLKFTANNMSAFQKAYDNGFDDFENEAGERQVQTMGYLLENYITWNKRFNKHQFTLTAGNSYIDKGKSTWLEAEGETTNDLVPNISVAMAPEVHEATVGYANPSETSYFGRLVYGFDSKYILSASFRRDGSSIFGANNKFGNFPSVGFAWNAGKEEFFSKIKNLSELKLRMSWGKTGNSNGDPYQTGQFIYNGNHAGTLIYAFGTDEEIVPGTTINSFPNPLLKWEETTQTDVGIDVGLFGNNLRFSVDWYKRTNKDLLIKIPLPNSTGVGSVLGDPTLLSNAASVENTGLEVLLAWSKRVTKNFNYSVSLNGAYSRNKVISIGSEFLGEIFGGFIEDDLPLTITRAGDPIGSFYGLKVDHLDKASGDFVFKDLNGDNDINEADKTVLGNPIPKFLYGGTIELGYKNFDLSLLLTGAAGLKIYNQLNFLLRGTSYLHNVSTDLLDKKDKYPTPFQNAEENLEPSDFYIENGSFIKAKSLSIGYSLPVSKLKSMSNGVIKNVRFYITAENLFTITPYSGYDPEVGRINGDFIFSRGIDAGFWGPQPRTVLAGIQLSL